MLVPSAGPALYRPSMCVDRLETITHRLTERGHLYLRGHHRSFPPPPVSGSTGRCRLDNEYLVTWDKEAALIYFLAAGHYLLEHPDGVTDGVDKLKIFEQNLAHYLFTFCVINVGL